jgi:hypothetical protein
MVWKSNSMPVPFKLLLVCTLSPASSGAIIHTLRQSWGGRGAERDGTDRAARARFATGLAFDAADMGLAGGYAFVVDARDRDPRTANGVRALACKPFAL